jgi:hypothetical protein
MANFELDRLQSQLNTSGLSNKDKPLYQVISLLIKYLRGLEVIVGGITNIIGGGGGGTTTNIFNDRRTIITEQIEEIEETYIMQIGNQNSSSSALDYVVMSDGGIPVPLPVNDGAGNFIYIPYVP